MPESHTMSKLPRTCPQCRTPLGPNCPQRNGQVRCPECSAVIAPLHDELDVMIQAVPTRAGAVRSGTSARRDEEDPDRFTHKGNRHLVWLVCAGLGLGFLGLACLFLIGGGIGLWLTVRQAATVDDVPAEVAIKPETVAVPVAVVPVVNADPGFVPNKPPPQQPLPPKEAIKPAAQGDGPAVGTLPLDELKAASVYVKATTATVGASGSGFVVRSQGDTVWVVTNHHVIAPSVEHATTDAQPPAQGPQMPFDPFPQPFGPQLPPFGPQLPPFGRPHHAALAVWPSLDSAADVVRANHSGGRRSFGGPAQRHA